MLDSEAINTDLEKIQTSKELFTSNKYKEKLSWNNMIKDKDKPSPKVIRVQIGNMVEKIKPPQKKTNSGYNIAKL